MTWLFQLFLSTEWLCAFIAIINTLKSLFKASDTFDDFQVLIKMADSHRNCQHHKTGYVLRTFIYVIHRLGGPYWKKLCPRSWVPPEGIVSLNTDQPRQVNNIFIFFLLRFKSFRKILLQHPTYVCWRRACSRWCYSKRSIDCKPKQNITTWF